MKRYLSHFALLLFAAAPLTSFAQSEADKEGVKMAALDYVEGLYLVKPERIERSVSKDLAKIGYWRRDVGRVPGVADVLSAIVRSSGQLE